MTRQAAYHDDQRARDAARHQQEFARVDRQLADLRGRIRDLERATGCADISIAPRTAARLRAFAAR